MADWHPILAADEVQPGVWVLRDPRGNPYGSVQLRRTKDGPRYRTEHRGELIGWGTSLRQSCMRLHQMMLREGVPGLPAGSPWPDKDGNKL
ncbi:hypothetical protein SK224_08415 [Microbacterium sp. BG28]|uniref:hypothetical protein n=1 Tax=Microbacterium sp. BG28 TaxID=3097356 RepID=UPI002A5A9FE2|nr:hypothetical protein [Microbacterium sp. BG28]MDY0829148.1 hypothetical protein [Microbacterium sp. BG28]